MDVVEPAMVVMMDKSGGPTLRQRLEWWGLRLALGVARRLSVERVAAIGAVVLGRVGPRLRPNRRTLANLAIVFPDRSPAEREAIARAMWANMGRTFAETLVLDRLIADPSRIEITDLATWERRAAEPGPIVGCTLHMGNWELTPRPFSVLGRPPAGVYKRLDNPLVDAWLRETRSPFFPAGLLGKGARDDSDGTGQRTARQLLDRARSGGVLGFVVDHFDRRGDPVRFFGRQARFATAPAAIARHVGARVWVGRCMRIGTASRFRFELQEVPVPRTGDRKSDAAALTAQIFAVFEQWIRESPEQWMWWNTRWVGGEDQPARAEAATGPVVAQPASGPG
ncbi:MAG: lysophospholipid acyltransferase family protein [Hyphomicrobiaceae bacterium]